MGSPGRQVRNSPPAARSAASVAAAEKAEVEGDRSPCWGWHSSHPAEAALVGSWRTGSVRSSLAVVAVAAAGCSRRRAAVEAGVRRRCRSGSRARMDRAA